MDIVIDSLSAVSLKVTIIILVKICNLKLISFHMKNMHNDTWFFSSIKFYLLHDCKTLTSNQ